MQHTLKWFQNRVGRLLFRDEWFCKCPNCNHTVTHGLIVKNKQHAKELFEIQGELEINYRDKK